MIRKLVANVSQLHYGGSITSDSPMQRRHLLALPALLAAPAIAQERVVNIYSARHYDTDRELWDAFTRQSGIRVRVIEANVDQLLERIRAEGANSPADILITVDIGRLARAKDGGVFQPTRNAALEAKIPAHLRDPQGHWFGFASRARVVMYDKARGLPARLTRYEDLARAEFANGLLVRSSGYIYNIGWTASMLAADGLAATEAWARGIAQNLARPPSGGDRDQIRAMIAGQGRLAIANTYYLGLLHISPRAEERELAERVGVLFPNQGDRGTHMNVSGAGIIRNAPNRAAAEAFLEYMASPAAQALFAGSNMEYPVVADAQIHPFLRGLGSFRQDPISASDLAANMPEALRLMQRAGWR
jgi:iron(III) transport system substrate-binding protein